MKKALLITFCIVLLATISTFVYFSTRIVFNEENAKGNTSGNLLNGGLFCEDDGKIYFSNPEDNGNLYVMNNDCTNFKKLYSDNAADINAAGNYVIYSRKNYLKDKKAQGTFVFSNVGIYRFDKSRGNIKQLYRDPVETVNLAGNYVYYQHYSEDEKPLGLTFFKVKIDGTEETLLDEDPIDPVAIQDNILYYIGTKRDHNIYAMDLTTNSTSLFYEGNVAFCIVQDDYVYFMDLDNNHALTRIDLDGSNKTVLVEQATSTYNISLSGKYIYYQVDEEENAGIYQYDTLSSETTLIQSGYFNSIHVTSNYVFFKEFNSDITYTMLIGDNNTVGTFHPPVIK